MPRTKYAAIVDDKGNVLAGQGAQPQMPAFNDPNQAIAWLNGPGYGLPMGQWSALHNQAIQAQTTGGMMPAQSPDALKNLQAAVELHNMNLTGQRTGQEIGQSAMTFPMLLAQKQQDLINSGLTGQKTGQEISQSGASFPLLQQQRQQEIMNGGITAGTGIENQLQSLAKGYGGLPGDILSPGSLARRDLVFDPKTGAYRGAVKGETPDMANTLSFYTPPQMLAPDALNPMGKTIPGTYHAMDDPGAQVFLHLAARRNQMLDPTLQGQPGMQGGQMQQQDPQAMANPTRQNTGWGIFGNYGQVGTPGQPGSYQTNYLPDEANAAGMSPIGYLQAILAKQQAQQPMVQVAGQGQPSGYTYQMPKSPQELASARAQQAAYAAKAATPDASNMDEPSLDPNWNWNQQGQVQQGPMMDPSVAAGAALRNRLAGATTQLGPVLGNFTGVVANRMGDAITNGVNGAYGFFGGTDAPLQSSPAAYPTPAPANVNTAAIAARQQQAQNQQMQFMQMLQGGAYPPTQQQPAPASPLFNMSVGQMAAMRSGSIPSTYQPAQQFIPQGPDPATMAALQASQARYFGAQ